jgi:hypothetical protein
MFIFIIFLLSYITFDQYYTIFSYIIDSEKLCKKRDFGFRRDVNEICALLGFYAA